MNQDLDSTLSAGTPVKQTFQEPFLDHRLRLDYYPCLLLEAYPDQHDLEFGNGEW